jgi:molybdate transport system permease protein
MLWTVVTLMIPGSVAADGGASSRGEDDKLTVLVAASVNDVVTELVDAYRTKNAAQGPAILVSAGPSGALLRQIELSAPCDLFITANGQHIDALVAQGIGAPGTRCRLARNTLVVATNSGHALASEPTWDEPDQLLRSDIRRIVMASPEYAPVGHYARQAMSRAELWNGLQDKLVLANNARMAASHIESGAVDAGIIYRSDVLRSPTLTTLYRFPPDNHDAAAYAGMVISRNVAARELLAFLQSTAARDTWRKHGFSVAGAPPFTKAMLSTQRAPSFLWQPLWISMKVSATTVLLLLVPGVALASWLARTRARWAWLVEAIVMAPLVLPPVVTGFMILIVIKSVAGGILFTWWGAVLASAVVGLPLLVRTARAGFDTVDDRYRLIAATLGQPRWRIFLTITLPLAWPGVVGGLMLAWARSIGEFGATIVVAGNFPGRTRTLPLAIWTAIQQSPAPPELVYWLAISASLAVLSVVLGEIMVRRFARRSAGA